MKPIIISALLMCLIGCNRQPEVMQGIDEPTNWMYITSLPFGDGGSVALGFLDSNGRIIYLWADSPMSSPDKRRFFLQRTFNDSQRIEVKENSALEKRVLALIDGCMKFDCLDSCIVDIHAVRKMLLDRNMPFHEFLRRSGLYQAPPPVTPSPIPDLVSP